MRDKPGHAYGVNLVLSSRTLQTATEQCCQAAVWLFRTLSQNTEDAYTRHLSILEYAEASETPNRRYAIADVSSVELRSGIKLVLSWCFRRERCRAPRSSVVKQRCGYFVRSHKTLKTHIPGIYLF